MSATLEYIRTNLTKALIAICILTLLISYFFIAPPVTAAATELSNWNTNIGTFALFTGLIVIIIRYARTIVNREEDWVFCLYTLALIACWTTFGIYYGVFSDTYIKAYYTTKIALHAASIGLLVFFYLSAIYRVFRMKNFRTALFAVAASILVAANSPWGQSVFPGISTFGAWLLDNLQMPGARTIVVVAGIGGIALSIRILLGLERGALRAVRSGRAGGED